MNDAQQKKSLHFTDEVIYQMAGERLLRSIRLLQLMIFVLIVLVGVLLYKLLQISNHVDAAVRSVDAIHQGITDTFKAGLPELKEARDLAKQLNNDLAEGGRLSQRLKEATDSAVDRAKRELPAAVDQIIEQKVKEFERRVRE
jgi:hypothetical protein